ncbi:Thioredoxin protein 4A [Phytophthora nicotianae]|uniref:Thioredoxin protein 4A n=1 Tax=Phytophthora nicotianae TaxID=4792 RepID=A0A0W8DDT5_PHYNI|nr:Thioredoxin protein 4A [Phytophthora nicotianae]
MNIQPDAILDTVTFQNLSLSGLDSALPLNSVKRIYVNNCSLSEIPTAAVAGDSVTVMYDALQLHFDLILCLIVFLSGFCSDLAGNAITKVDTNFQEETFSNLTLLRSELWLGEYKHEAVLIKKIKSNTASKALMRDFVTEIELMFELKHPRIAAFKGAMWDADGTELCAVVEYVEKGALRDCTVNNAIELSVPKQHAIARQISEAMRSCTSKKSSTVG